MRPGSQDPLGSDEDYLSTGGPATHLGHQVRIGSLADSLDPHSVPALTCGTPLPTIGFPTRTQTIIDRSTLRRPTSSPLLGAALAPDGRMFGDEQ